MELGSKPDTKRLLHKGSFLSFNLVIQMLEGSVVYHAIGCCIESFIII